MPELLESALITAADLAQIADPLQRAKAADAVLSELAAASEILGRIRAEAVPTLSRDGMSYAQIGKALGMTRQRVEQIMSAERRRQWGPDHVVKIDPARERRDALEAARQAQYQRAERATSGVFYRRGMTGDPYQDFFAQPWKVNRRKASQELRAFFADDTVTAGAAEMQVTSRTFRVER